MKICNREDLFKGKVGNNKMVGYVYSFPLYKKRFNFHNLRTWFHASTTMPGLRPCFFRST